MNIKNNNMPKLSPLYETRKPSSIRLASIEFAKRTDKVKAVNVAIGNVSLPMHPKMIERMKNLDNEKSPFKTGVVKYTGTQGTDECNQAFMKILNASGLETKNLFSQITDGGSHGMELVIAGVASREHPIMLINPAYTNYQSFAQRLGIPYVSVNSELLDDGTISLAEIGEIEKMIIEKKPSALIVIPFDNPTGQLIKMDDFISLAKLCVKYDMWLVSDEAYREIYYTQIDRLPSIWGITNEEVEGIEGCRISIESTSKVWNACGLRIGAIITDNENFHNKCVAEQTANLCANSIGQYIFSAIGEESIEDLQKWFESQRNYYKKIVAVLESEFAKHLPNVIVSKPEAALYSIVDVKKIVPADFDCNEFVLFCAQKGKVDVDGQKMTLLLAPMENKTQMRIAYVLQESDMKLVPQLLKLLLEKYLQ